MWTVAFRDGRLCKGHLGTSDYVQGLLDVRGEKSFFPKKFWKKIFWGKNDFKKISLNFFGKKFSEKKIQLWHPISDA